MTWSNKLGIWFIIRCSCFSCLYVRSTLDFADETIKPRRFCVLITMKLATLLASLAAVTTSAFSPISTTTQLQSSFSRYAASASNSQLFAMPICIVVEAEIKEDRMDDFLDMIEKNAVGSRAEPGCIRFGMY
mmetsp:Transcript_36381/g.74163  ORF Transcript_36381/g.74163 Transcript_36381/m.74163 type:complete len:132 (+) Transcript_36381:285-680(+)